MTTHDPPLEAPPVARVTDVYCTQCGAVAGLGHRFCGSCGSALVAASSVAPTSEYDSPSGALEAGKRLLDAGDLPAAIASLETACAESESSSRRLLLGIAYLRAGRVHDARDMLERAETLAPATFACEVAFGEYHARLGFYDRAVERLERALALPAPDARARDVAVELHRYCRDRAKKMFYRSTPLPRWTARLRRHASPHDAAQDITPAQQGVLQG